MQKTVPPRRGAARGISAMSAAKPRTRAALSAPFRIATCMGIRRGAFHTHRANSQYVQSGTDKATDCPLFIWQRRALVPFRAVSKGLSGRLAEVHTFKSALAMSGKSNPSRQWIALAARPVWIS